MDPLVWFVTGASSGIGHEVALSASRRGDKVIAVARNEERLDGLARLGCQTALLDVASLAPDIRRVIDRVVAEFGSIDMLVNVAGYIPEGCGEETGGFIPPSLHQLDSDAELVQLYTTNIFRPLRLINAVLPYMRSWRQGVIANVAGISALRGAPGARQDRTAGDKRLRCPVGAFPNELSQSRSQFKIEAKVDNCQSIMESIRETFSSFYGAPQGDPRDAGRLIVEVLTKSGRAAGRKVPGYFAVGSDVPTAMEHAHRSIKEQGEALGNLVGATDISRRGNR
ncbi:MAG: hypothetical protein M1830_009860 [Pleopsidium flavum]|nr:MAG: hypothetical protein M1830_009860 [Pleopsidium flavum]